MSVTEVQNSGEADISATPATSFTVSLTGVTAGNVLVLVGWTLSNGATFSSVSGGGASWSYVINEDNTTQPAGSQTDAEIWVGTGTTGGSVTITVNLSASDSGQGILFELSGASGLVDGPPGTSTSGSTETTTIISPTLNPTASGEWAVFVAGTQESSVTGFPSSPWTSIQGPQYGNSGTYGDTAYQTISSTSALSITWTTGSSIWVSVAAVFSATGSGGLAWIT